MNPSGAVLIPNESKKCYIPVMYPTARPTISISATSIGATSIGAILLTTMSIVTMSIAILACPHSAAACPDVEGFPDMLCNGDAFRVAFFGDSITVGQKWDYNNISQGSKGFVGRFAQQHPNMIVGNFGNGGEDTNQGLRRFTNTFKNRFGQFRIIHINEGVNDYYNVPKSAASTKSALLAMVRIASNIGALPVLSNLAPNRRRGQSSFVASVNRLIKSVTDVDFYSLGNSVPSPKDGLHPSGHGYDLMYFLANWKMWEKAKSRRPADTDGDGVYDFIEQQKGLDLYNPDTDGDGASDGEELYVYGTNPFVTDSDGDGYTDGQEATMGTNPASKLPQKPTLTNLQALP